MIRIMINGALGKMGRMVTEMVAAEPAMEVVAGIDRFAAGASVSYPLFEKMGAELPKADVLIDFSRPEALPDILSYCTKHSMAAVLATTGYTDGDFALIQSAAQEITIFQSANMSLGINLLMGLSREAASVLKGFDIEIVEAHHNTKVDAPSGTALMLADGINRELSGNRHYVFGRHTKTERRQPAEIGIHAIRGGTVTGEHQVLFFGQDEVIHLTHSAQSRRIYALGALRAAAFIVGRRHGVYNMHDLLLEHHCVTSLLIDKEQAMLSIRGLLYEPRSVASVFTRLADRGILVDMISQSAPHEGSVDLSFTLPIENVEEAMQILAKDAPHATHTVTKLTIEGRGMERQAGVAAKVLERLANDHVGVVLITTSETKIGLLIDETSEHIAIAAIRDAFSLA